MADTRRDEIIESKVAERMLDRVSPIYDNSYVGLWMFEAIGVEYDKLWYIANTMPDQLFPESVTWAIELWEKRYNIVPTSTQTIEERRQKIISARSIPKPFNPAALQQYIHNLVGRESEIIDFIRTYTFAVFITSNDTMENADYEAIAAYINRHKPSHMSYDLTFQTAPNIHIGVQTAYWRYNYAMAGEAEAGQLPDTNIAAAQSSELAAIRASPQEVAYIVHYPQCGTTSTGASGI